MTKNYGCPYRGSKNKIAEAVMEAIPHQGIDTFIDLFAGGCAITHRALLEGNFKHYIANDKVGDGVRLFRSAISGELRDERRWISRDDFFRLKSTDPYVKYCWSFGNGGMSYMYSKEIEPWKRALHYARVLGDYSLLREMGVMGEATRLDIKAHFEEYTKKYILWYKKTFSSSLQSLERLQSLQGLQKIESLKALQSFERLQRLQRLESLQRHERLQRLAYSVKSYEEVTIPPQSVIYCDPPYKGTEGYITRSGKDFDHEKFYKWCEKQTELVIISEYSMPEERFECVWAKEKKCCMAAANVNSTIEKIFIPKHQVNLYYERMNALRLFEQQAI